MNRDVGRGMMQAQRMPIEGQGIKREARPLAAAQRQNIGQPAPARLPPSPTGGGSARRPGPREDFRIGNLDKGAIAGRNIAGQTFQDAQDEALMKAFRDLMQPVDTAEQEAAIRAEYQRAAADKFNDSRARAGAAGFEGSGALMALEGDVQRAALEAAMGDIYGVRDRANARYDQNVSRAAAIADMMQGRALDERIVELGFDALAEPKSNPSIDSDVAGDAYGQTYRGSAGLLANPLSWFAADGDQYNPYMMTQDQYEQEKGNLQFVDTSRDGKYARYMNKKTGQFVMVPV